MIFNVNDYGAVADGVTLNSRAVQAAVDACALAGGGILMLLYFGAIALLKREAMGFADVKLVAAAGLLLGWQRLILAMLIGSLVGSVVMLTLNRVNDKEKDAEYPFGPFICGGVLVALFAGEVILNWYVGLILG